MENYKLQLQQMLDFFVEEEKKYKNELQALPSGTLQHVQSGSRSQFIWNKDGKRSGINKRPDIIRQLARKEFVCRLLAEIESNISVLERTIAEFRDTNPSVILSSMTKAYRKLQADMFFPSGPKEIILTSMDEDVAERLASHESWANQPYEKNPYPMGPYAQITSRGLQVRSTRELYIAERLYYYNIPFRYDQIIHFNGYVLSPDFTFEQIDGTPLYLEYCGMMNDPNYIARFIHKRQKYERCGIYEWDNMIYVFSKERQINTQEIDDVIRNRILPRL